METLIPELEAILNARFTALARRMPGPVPPHRVRFSKRITTSWALIYYRRHLIRLSPYLFLLEPHELKHETYWRELDATIRHEVVHAYLYERDRTRDHPPEFHRILRGLDVEPNGECDLGPTNRAYRYMYACPGCERRFPRRVPLKGNWSCARCSNGRYDPDLRLFLAETLPPPWERLRAHSDRVRAALAEGRAALDADTLVPLRQRRPESAGDAGEAPA